MAEYAGRRSGTASELESASAVSQAPGKHTLVASLPALEATTPVQRLEAADAARAIEIEAAGRPTIHELFGRPGHTHAAIQPSATSDQPRGSIAAVEHAPTPQPRGQASATAVQAAAEHGTSGAAAPLPHLDTIQRSFGKHDVRQVRAHVDGNARAANQALGAKAFATGDRVAFREAPDLFVAAHEAAHVVQQRGGVQLKGHVGEVGDTYEQHADAVAHAVVRGESAEALLEPFAGRSASAAPAVGRHVQRYLHFHSGFGQWVENGVHPVGAYLRCDPMGRGYFEMAMGAGLATSYDGRNWCDSVGHWWFYDGSRGQSTVTPVKQTGGAPAKQTMDGPAKQTMGGPAKQTMGGPAKQIGVSSATPMATPPPRGAQYGTLQWTEKDGWHIVPGSLLAAGEILKVDASLLPRGLPPEGDAKTQARVKYQSEGSKLLSIQATQGVSTTHIAARQQMMIEGADRWVSIQRIDPPGGAQRVIFQAGYMSGDRYGVAAALQLDPALGVMILRNASDTKADELHAFYKPIAHDRLGTCSCGDSQALYRVLNDDLDKRAEFAKLGGFQAELLPLGQATRIVAREFQSDADDETTARARVEGARQKIVSGWFGDQTQIAAGNEQIRTWLRNEIHMQPGAYALLWTKTGAMTDEKAYHYTDAGAWKQLLAAVNESHRVPVLIGEPMPELPPTEPSLVHFWNRKFPGKSRIDQQRLYHFFHASDDYDVINIGMKSGATEGPALMGLRTIYLEEAHNSQAGRMEQWLTALPNFMRVILDAPPGAEQKKALAGTLRKDVGPQGQKRLAPTMGRLADGFGPFMEQRARRLDDQAGKPEQGFSKDELAAIDRLLRSDATQWKALKQTDYGDQELPSKQQRFAGHNPHWEDAYSRDGDGILHRSLDDITPRLTVLRKRLEVAYQSVSDIRDGATLFAAPYRLVGSYLQAIQDRFVSPDAARRANAVCDDLAGQIENAFRALRTLVDEKQAPETATQKLGEFIQIKVDASFLWWG